MPPALPEDLSPRIVVRAPPAQLAPFVARFMLVEYLSQTDDVHFPDAGMTAAFHYRGESVLYGSDRAPDAGITGLFDRERAHRHGAGSRLALVAFSAGGAASLLRVAADELANSTHDLADVAGKRSDWSKLVERLSAARDDDARFDLLERFFLARLGAVEIDLLTLRAAERIQAAHGRVLIGRLAADFGLSASAFTRRFRRQVGAAPKTFASIARLRHVLRVGPDEPNLTSLAMAADYFDQAHFIRDFRAMTGKTPGRHFGKRAFD